MSDGLDRLLPPAATLLARVDAVLVAHGVPPAHPVTALLRKLGALPADVLDAISAWRPAPLRDAAADLRQTAEEYASLHGLLTAPAGWAGPTFEGFAAHQAALSEFLGEPGLEGRLLATAAYLDEVAEWLDRSRGELARSVADALGSAEAVRVHASGDAEAAVAIATRILEAAAEAYDRGQEIADRWAGRLDEISYRPPASTAALPNEIRVAL
ncbi:hypothetical protein HC028_04230 [Planosporangium flavigriseum]|uniref:Uncharacterized protein n=1 Tax=Planosporangium flavigriseum TaxID=373681 RepID=A0A8J3PLG5_9ACTN|nr:hypothetical protein [Planosporangium flavigriseum]NJC63718.1 hypothetical protein [Planosporangium flavigriseum]GIG73787.1 hypothetical protein Pfl04_21910 [Planosporangium flavigriseum]